MTHRFHSAYEPFTCAICTRHFDCSEPYFINTRSAPISPVCLSCEYTWGQHAIGKVDGGSFRDRRIVRLGAALADALSAHCYRKLDGGRYGQA